MSIFSKMMDDRKRSKKIEKKMKETTTQKAVSGKASKLKDEFGLSDDEAEFMAKRELKKEKRFETIDKLSTGFGNVLAGLDPDVPKQAPSKKTSDQDKRAKGSGKKGKGSGKKDSSKPKDSKKKKDPLGMPELDLDLPGFKF